MAGSSTLGDWLGERPFTLGMSSGFFGFFAHAGMLATLESSSLTPSRVVGSSAGALVAGMWAAGLSGEDICELLGEVQRRDFWDPRPGFGLLRGRSFRTLLEEFLPVSTFEECRAPVAMSVFDIRTRKTVVVSRGSLAAAIHASCAVPMLFHPVRLNGRLVYDGGILDRPGLAGALDVDRTFYHHLSSRSPWRRVGSPALRIPERPAMKTLSIPRLTRVSPLRLDRGMFAMREAREATRLALDSPAESSVFFGDASAESPA